MRRSVLAAVAATFIAGPVSAQMIRFWGSSTAIDASGAPADNKATPTSIPPLLVYPQVYDGTQWDMLRGTSADGMLVNLGTNNDVSINAGTNNIGDVDVEIVGAPGVIGTAQTAKTADFDLVTAAANTRVLYVNCRESAGTPAVATVALRHENVATTCDSTSVLAFVELAANGMWSEGFGDRGIAVASGICVDVLAGEVDCAVTTIVEAAP